MTLREKNRLPADYDPARALHIGQPVIARSYRTKEKWIPGVITAYPELVSYEVSVALT